MDDDDTLVFFVDAFGAFPRIDPDKAIFLQQLNEFIIAHLFCFSSCVIVHEMQ